METQDSGSYPRIRRRNKLFWHNRSRRTVAAIFRKKDAGTKVQKKKEQAMKTVHPNVAVLVMTDREGNLLFKHTGENKVQNSQIKEELKRRVSESN
jgi:hypothetical protein